MATASVNLSIQDITNNATYNPTAFSLTLGDAIDARKLDIGTSEETVTLNSDVATSGTGNGPALCYIRNFDTSNYVQVGTSSGSYFGRVRAASSMVFQLDNGVSAIYLKANTAACVVQVVAWEDTA